MKKRSKPSAEEPPTADEVREAALRLLARREHSRKELGWKLEARHWPAELVIPVLDRLEGERLLSDARFTEVFVWSRRERGYGPLRIRAELRERGVDETLVEAALEGGDAEWGGRARELCRRRFGDKAPANWDERARRGRYLAQRGFSSEQIRYALDARDVD